MNCRLGGVQERSFRNWEAGGWRCCRVFPSRNVPTVRHRARPSGTARVVAWCGGFQCGTSLRDVRNQGVGRPFMTVQQRTCIILDACGTMGRRASGLLFFHVAERRATLVA